MSRYASTWARAVSLDGGPAQRLPYGPVTALDLTAGGGVVLGTEFGGRRRDPAMWKRDRGGTAGRLWIDPEGSGMFVRRVPVRPRGRGQRVLRLPAGSDLRRHTDHFDYYARHASSDGERVVYAAAGELCCSTTWPRTPSRGGWSCAPGVPVRRTSRLRYPQASTWGKSPSTAPARPVRWRCGAACSG
ncbi:MAG TPA: hypothetical protein VE673_11025 [Pseudonocardiaceae bacterium]|nr:hypothetical protein [Pseudonocardiaceae bacterium]